MPDGKMESRTELKGFRERRLKTNSVVNAMKVNLYVPFVYRTVTFSKALASFGCLFLSYT